MILTKAGPGVFYACHTVQDAMPSHSMQQCWTMKECCSRETPYDVQGRAQHASHSLGRKTSTNPTDVQALGHVEPDNLSS